MSLFPCSVGRDYLVRVLAVWLMLLGRVHAEPTIVSTVPPNGANGVPLSATLVITFSEVMDTSRTTAYLFDPTTYQVLWASSSWSGGGTVLTCTPTDPFPASRTIWWTVNGTNSAGVGLGGYTGGTFTTVSAGPLTLTNALWNGGTFAFDVASQAGQAFTVEYNTALRSNQWQTLLTTNSPAGLVHIVDPQSSTNLNRFYRARNGS